MNISTKPVVRRQCFNWGHRTEVNTALTSVIFNQELLTLNSTGGFCSYHEEQTIRKNATKMLRHFKGPYRTVYIIAQSKFKMITESFCAQRGSFAVLETKWRRHGVLLWREYWDASIACRLWLTAQRRSPPGQYTWAWGWCCWSTQRRRASAPPRCSYLTCRWTW